MKHLFLLLYTWLVERCIALFTLSNLLHKLLYIKGFNRVRNFNAVAKSYTEFVKAKRTVPAYRDFLKVNNFNGPTFKGMTPNLDEIPVTDKENYVKKYKLDQRCVNGSISNSGVIIDESSGSSGTANNWARGKKERDTNARMIKFGLQNLFGSDPVFLLNAFALGAWATGTNITISCVKFAKIKSIGPDKIKIENTLKYFGNEHKYIIMGYPPFLKSLVDDVKINWKDFDISFIFGGEPMAEEMRDYLLSKGIKKVYSSLGASDIELNMATENDFTINLRRLLRSNESLRDKILKYKGALPMVFQYNPSDFLIEVNENGELIFTVCKTGYIAPKIRYNLHDKGHVLQMHQLQSILKDFGIEAEELISPQTDLPLLFHYGRADMTVSFYGSTISPVDIQEAIYGLPQLVETIHSFYIETPEDVDGNKNLVIAFEIQENKDLLAIDVEQMQPMFFDKLASINQDFREAKKMLASSKQTQIVLYAFGQGPFKDADIRIKAKYIK
ncbi:hypothetical protein EZ449_15185 [Pedobacter frigidisoli]|uniref:Phenylacetate-CoA ligase n=1 Tax=Pedobacter frigidisoli TaxID=2530455 RepID=A0A4R0P515_9SPHI|nr:hypothetical protein [Pedobacter frigidisoli]TCD07131.1 hypothetical protein EZ449_15185 [Pedobacter frigidisoli]